MGLGPVQFSQGQLRDTLGISVETFRHWKRVLPPFAERKRYTRRFSVGDLLAAGVLHRLTDQCGVRVGFLPEISKAVVEICNTSPWAALEDKALIVDVQQRTCRTVKNVREFTAQDIVIVCPLGPIMTAMRDALSRTQPSVAQQPLRFLPTAIGEIRARRRRA
jgi:hypothetical protein